MRPITDISNKPLYKPFVSKRKNKKYSVYVKVDGKTKLIHFGDSRMQQFKDKLHHYKRLDHNDSKRRESYRKRAMGITNKKGEKTYNDKNTANYWAFTTLW